ncbi:MAG: GNAT family N-acetyltransferase [Candidatus Thiodiazotropha sp. DIVDIV]
MSNPDASLQYRMKDGTGYQVQLCIEPDTKHTISFLKDQISIGFKSLSNHSRMTRFASPINRLSDRQLDYLTNLDGKNRVAWCAFIDTEGEEKGLGLGRYMKLPDHENIAEFAITVVDGYQGQGVGFQLLTKLIASAKENSFHKLRGYVMKDNKPMLALCKRFDSKKQCVDGPFVILDILVND